ncbi:MAG TPA: alpha/beta hydrolase [Enteractinococcus helveticum]|uniref:Alpha/beta hydrolase n=1 Tax=Enteractinococcus helveticum TaxID=1837282 RepID=A0A921FJQ3_9MICC|nr:alpha/beta hydrolase [Enteractinococcus helveticum]HJF13353.1 alpha/beta hydrolase [Enteractinococcus helveticum]
MSSHNRPVQSADVDAVSVPSSVQVTHGLVYARRDTGELLFDLYHPAVDHPVPVIIWLHGGGWFTGDRTLSPDLSQIVAQSGYAVASIDYRLSGQALFPAQLHDVRAAVRFLRSNAHTYGLDPQGICLWGASAGGHLALLVGLTGPVRQLPGEDEPGETRVAAVAASYPPIDLLDIVDQAAERLPGTDPLSSPEARLIGGHPAQHPRASKYASPLNWITPLAPPIQLSHGLADPLVPYHQSVRMHEALAAAGTASELYLVDEYKHGFLNPAGRLDVALSAVMDDGRLVDEQTPPAWYYDAEHSDEQGQRTTFSFAHVTDFFQRHLAQ